MRAPREQGLLFLPVQIFTQFTAFNSKFELTQLLEIRRVRCNFPLSAFRLILSRCWHCNYPQVHWFSPATSFRPYLKRASFVGLADRVTIPAFFAAWMGFDSGSIRFDSRRNLWHEPIKEHFNASRVSQPAQPDPSAGHVQAGNYIRVTSVRLGATGYPISVNPLPLSLSLSLSRYRLSPSPSSLPSQLCGKCISYSCIQVFGFWAQAERAKSPARRSSRAWKWPWVARAKIWLPEAITRTSTQNSAVKMV